MCCSQLHKKSIIMFIKNLTYSSESITVIMQRGYKSNSENFLFIILNIVMPFLFKHTPNQTDHNDPLHNYHHP